MEQKTKWEQWQIILTAAMMANFSICVIEIIRAGETARLPALFRSLDVLAAKWKTVSILCLTFGRAAKKALVDRNSTLEIQTLKLKEQLQEEQRVFENPNNYLPRFNFLGKWKRGEPLEHFWNVKGFCKLWNWTTNKKNSVRYTHTYYEFKLTAGETMYGTEKTSWLGATICSKFSARNQTRKTIKTREKIKEEPIPNMKEGTLFDMEEKISIWPISRYEKPKWKTH